MAPLDDRAMQLAVQQFGVLARFQLRRWSTGRQIDGLVTRGSLHPIQRGVYRVAGGAVLPSQLPLAAALRCRGEGTVTGPFVLGHLRVDGFDDRAPYELLLPPGCRVRGVEFPSRRDPYPDRPVIRLGDVRLASPADALIDACRWRSQLGDRRLRLAYDWLRWRGIIDVTRVLRTLDVRARGDEGARQLIDLLGGRDGLVAESEGERKLGALLRRFDPAPAAQLWVTDRRRVDWYFARARLAVEYQGSVDHDTDVGRRADAERERELGAAGIIVVQVRRADLDDREGLAARLAGRLAVRAAELGIDPPRYRLR